MMFSRIFKGKTAMVRPTLDGIPTLVDTCIAPEKKGPGLIARFDKGAQPRKRFFYVCAGPSFVLYEWRWRGSREARRFPLSPVDQSRHLPLTPFDRGARFNRQRNTMNRTDPISISRTDAPASPGVSAASQQQPQPSVPYRSFSWLAPHCEHDQEAQFMAKTLDICQGINVCLGLVHSDDMIRQINEGADPGEEVPHTLGREEVKQLLLMAKGVAGLMADEAERRIRWMNGRT